MNHAEKLSYIFFGGLIASALAIWLITYLNQIKPK